MNKQVIILAAGKGSRMKVDKPKVLVEILGKPMIEYVLDSVKIVQSMVKPVVVVGHQGELVQDKIKDRATIVWQKEQLGTGHAVAIARNIFLNFSGAILVLYGDHPLISPKTIEKLFKIHEERNSVLSLMTTEVEDFTDWRSSFMEFGRIIRDNDNHIQSIREFKDCSDAEKKIKEVNPGYYCFDSVWLWQNIQKLQNKNNQKEYYLTDLISLAVAQNEKISSIQIPPLECLGVNTSEQLQMVENLIKNK